MDFKELPNGMKEGFVLLKKCDEKKTKSGSPYLDMIIADKNGEMSAKLWEANGASFEADTVIKIRGQVEKYNGKEQFRVSQIRPAGKNDEYNIADLIPASEIKGEQLYDMIKARVEGFENENLKSIVLSIMEEKKEKLVYYPAALRLHHAMVGGLMFHTMSIIRMAEEIADIYTNINLELLLSGIILHDVAKTWELETSKTGLAKGYSAEGELIGHLVKGAMYVSEKAKELELDCEEVALLEHMILSHHGVPEYGSPVRPMFLEAVILSTLDALDATIYEINEATSKVGIHEFTDRQWALDNRKLYNHGLADTKHSVCFVKNSTEEEADENAEDAQENVQTEIEE